MPGRTNNAATATEATPGLGISELFCFRWWYKGRTAEGNTMTLEGRVEARDASEACYKVEKQMRAKWPTVRWMQGRESEGGGVRFGPTVQKLKTPVKARKQNGAMSDCAGGKLKS